MFEKKSNNNEVFPNTLQYDVSTETLAEMYNMHISQYELTGNIGFDVVMLGNAFDFLDFAQEALEIELEFEEKDIPTFEEILGMLHEWVEESGMEQDTFNLYARCATAYFGVLILKYIGGNWVDTQQGVAIRKDEKDAFVYHQVAQRIAYGQEFDVVKYYEKLKEC